MRKKVFRLLLGLYCLAGPVAQLVAQAPNDAPASANTMAGSKFASVPVNTFTGIPSISVPVYSFSHPSGIGTGVSLDYFAGGIKLNEKASTVGLGWNLNAGGAIMRTVRGMPDDIPVKGFLYSSPVPDNYPSLGSLYYGDSIDAEQDVFQLSAEGLNCRFYIGKNKQIITAPLSKTKISYAVSPSDNATIVSFTVTSTSGVRYIFNEQEQTTDGANFSSGFQNSPYTTAWYISKIIAPFSTDTIAFNYTTVAESVKVPFSHQVNVKSDGSYPGGVSKKIGTQIIGLKKISSIVLPGNKSVLFVYDAAISYDGKDKALNRIKVYDSVFRYGYLLDRDSISPLCPRGHVFLTGLRYYTPTFVNKGYKFNYNIKFNPAPRLDTSSFNNRRDHWGFYNGINNGNYNYNSHAIPTTTGIFGTFTGANRNPVDSMVGANTISSVTGPDGGITYYQFEPNDIYMPYSPATQYLSFSGKAQTQNTISIGHGLSNKDSFTVSVSLRTQGTTPVSGNIIFWITNADSSVTYATNTFGLDSLCQKGYVSFNCANLPNGNVVFKSKLATGASVSYVRFYLNLSWVKYTATGQTKTTSGGIRIKQVLLYDPFTNKTDTAATYKYTMPDGKSSGFCNAMPVYSSTYRNITINGSTVLDTNYTTISSDPVNNMNYTQGSPVGYRRVEIIKGTPTRNLGKQVYEYTGLPTTTDISTDEFPYAPLPQRTWAIGLPTKVSVYDSLNRLVQTTTNTYTTVSNAFNNNNFKSCRLGLTGATFYTVSGDYEETYLGKFYYAESGRSDLTSSADTFYHPDLSATTSKKDIQYDTNYNATKIITPYDKTRSLNLENRIYYPYNYTVSGTVGKLRDSSIFVPVSTENWITGDATPRMLSAQITDFQQLPKGYIRPLYSYSLQSVSPVPQATIGSFNPASLVRNSTYFIMQQIFSGYDNASNLIESQNPFSQQYNTVVMDHGNSVAIAKISNAKNADVAYTSFEADSKGNWAFTSSARDTTDALTGRKSYNLANGAISKTGLTAGLTYLITYWRKSSGTVAVSNATGTALLTSQNGWDFYSQTLTGQTSVTVSGTAIIDELRLYPKDANMATSTYEPVKGITSACDAGNTVMYYEYDNFNRLLAERDRNKNILKKYEYPNNVTAIASFAPDWRATGQFVCEQSQSCTRNRVEKDSALYSETYGSIRYVFNNTDCVACPPQNPPCPTCQPSPLIKLINCVCETAERVNTSTTHVKVYNPATGLYDLWKWKCTYYYAWSDGSTAGPYDEYNDTACDVGLL